MTQLGFDLPAPGNHFTVSELNRRIRDVLEKDYRFQDIVVDGEISNLSRPASGHLYFTLKDDAAAIRCVMWKAQTAQLTYRPRDGDRVQAHGSVGVYEAGGQYQLYANWLQPAGQGDLFRQFNDLKAKLQAEGLFDRKRPIASRPARIAIVTSPGGAALRDMANVLRRRWAAVEVVICPTLVQGEDAPPKIQRAIADANRLQPDTIIIARGGGSLEDLWAFNDERVVRAVAASRAPTISGVGHETDFTLTDFAADLRAPTPSAAAELATPDRAQLLESLAMLRTRMAGGLSAAVRERRWRLSEQAAALKGLSPRALLFNSRQRLDELAERMERAATSRLAINRQQLKGVAMQLQALSPTAILQRGYAIVTLAESGAIVRQARQAPVRAHLNVQLAEGSIQVEVKKSDQE